MNGKISNLIQTTSLRRYTITEGREKGLEVIDCDNGRLRFLLNVSKACDMMQLYHGGVNLSFVSKNGFHPRELVFANRFEGGMIYTCGLDSLGEREGFEEHGSIHNVPAEILRAECSEEGIVVEALIRDTCVGGKNLVIRRKITTAIGSDTVRLEDVLTNRSYRDEPYCLLYHVNVGYPMLDEGARIEIDSETCLPRTECAARQLDSACRIDAPVPEAEETCYYFDPKNGKASLVNDSLGKRFQVLYSRDTLPHFLGWKSLASGDFAVGLEPATAKLDHLFEMKTLPAGESVRFCIELSVQNLEK